MLVIELVVGFFELLQMRSVDGHVDRKEKAWPGLLSMLSDQDIYSKTSCRGSMI